MVINDLMETLNYVIKKYGMNSVEAYNICIMMAIETQNLYNSKSLQNYYNETISALVEYLKQNRTNPNEMNWNKYAVENNYLSSETISYIYGKGFHILCKEIRKRLNEYKI